MWRRESWADGHSTTATGVARGAGGGAKSAVGEEARWGRPGRAGRRRSTEARRDPALGVAGGQENEGTRDRRATRRRAPYTGMYKAASGGRGGRASRKDGTGREGRRGAWSRPSRGPRPGVAPESVSDLRVPRPAPPGPDSPPTNELSGSEDRRQTAKSLGVEGVRNLLPPLPPLPSPFRVEELTSRATIVPPPERTACASPWSTYNPQSVDDQ